MLEKGFFVSLFFPDKEFILDPVSRRLKGKIERALMHFQLATDIEIGEKIPPQIFNAIDRYNFEKQDLHMLQKFRDQLEAQRERKGLLIVAQELVTSDDPVMRYCIAVELSEELLNKPHQVDLKNKNLSQLCEMAEKDGDRLVTEISKKIESILQKNNSIKNRSID